MSGGAGVSGSSTNEPMSPLFGLDPKYFIYHVDEVEETFKPFLIPFAGLIIGVIMMRVPKVADIGKLVLYFGAQSFMNIYMAWALRTSITLPKGAIIPGTNTTMTEDLKGCPAGFALTAFQQVVSFIVFMIFFCSVYFTPYRYTPKKLNSGFEIFCVVIFGCVFALNIALNNFSLAYISIAVNLIIRSCLPLSTLISQHVLAIFKLYVYKPCVLKEIILMVVGVLCALAFTMAKIMASGSGKQSSNVILGCVMCLASLFCGSLNLALAGVLGETKLNVYDTVAYMAVPATIFLAPIAIFLEKPVPPAWAKVFGKDQMTDFEILAGTWDLNKMTIFYLLLSGVFSFIYNIIQFSIVHTLSPSATAFGGNFNKAALVFLTLMLPFLRVHALPGPPYIFVIWGAVVCNIAAFSAYSYLQIQAKKQRDADASKKAKIVEDSSESEDDDEEEEDSDDSSDGKMC